MTPTKKAAAVAAFGSFMTFSAVSFAHVDLSAPTPRAHGQGEGNLKSGPCGQTTNARTTNINVFAPGETITVEWNEYIDHPSYFRIAFDDDGDDGFVQRTDNVTDQNADDPEAAEAALNMDAEILAIVGEENDTTSGASTDIRSTTVTLPNIECENCTLQLIQYMYDNPGTGYFQCADIALRAEQQVEPADAGAGGSPSGGGTGGAAGAGGSANAGTAGSGGAPGAGGSGGPIAPSNPPAQGGAAPIPSAGAGGAPSSVGGSGSVIGQPGEGEDNEDGGCSIATHVGAGSATPGLIGLFGLALGVLGRRRRNAR